MRIRLTLRPGQKGTKRLLGQYGDRLVYVRYRYDEQTGKRFKTVEIIVDESEWKPRKPADSVANMVSVRIGLHERELQRRAKRAGGKWNRSKQVWEMRHDRAVVHGLSKRIV